MMQDKALALTYTQIGGLTSILPVCYGKALLPTQTCVSYNAYTLLSTGQKMLFVKSMHGMQAQLQELVGYHSTPVHMQQYYSIWQSIQDIQAEISEHVLELPSCYPNCICQQTS